MSLHSPPPDVTLDKADLHYSDSGNAYGEFGIVPRDPEQPAQDIEAGEVSAVDISAMFARYPSLRPIVVDPILRATETCNLISATKIGKTHLAIGLAIAIRTGRPWLDRFTIPNPGPVLYVDAELHPETFTRRIKLIGEKMGVDPGELEGFKVLSLRGRGWDIDLIRLWAIGNAVNYRAIILDAWYRMQPIDSDENSNSDATRACNTMDAMAQETGAAVIAIHHFSKGSQSNKSIVDTGAGAGAMARAADTHLILREHEEAGCVVMDLAARSFPPLSPLVIRWQYPVFTVDDLLDPTMLKRDPFKGGRPRKSDRDAKKIVEEAPWTPQRFAQEFGTDTPTKREVIEGRANRAGLAFRTIGTLIAECEAEKLLYLHERKGSNAQFYARKSPELFADDGVSLSHTLPHTPTRARRGKRRVA